MGILAGATWVTYAALASAAIGTGVSVYSGIKQGELAKKAQKLKASQQAIEAQQERTKQVRAARTARAQILQAGASSGGESSSVTGGAQGALTQSYSNIEGINQQESGGKAQSAIAQGQQDLAGLNTLGQGISSIAGSVFQNRAEISDIFGVKTKP